MWGKCQQRNVGQTSLPGAVASLRELDDRKSQMRPVEKVCLACIDGKMEEQRAVAAILDTRDLLYPQNTDVAS